MIRCLKAAGQLLCLVVGAHELTRLLVTANREAEPLHVLSKLSKLFLAHPHVDATCALSPYVHSDLAVFPFDAVPLLFHCCRANDYLTVGADFRVR